MKDLTFFINILKRHILTQPVFIFVKIKASNTVFELNMPVSLHNIWIKIKVFFHLPFPLKNHYYKWQRISIKRNWFCESCKYIFNLSPWKKYKALRLDQWGCAYCNSKSIYYSTELFKAIVNKQVTSELMKIIEAEKLISNET